jgi:hypothetical protein
MRQPISAVLRIHTVSGVLSRKVGNSISYFTSWVEPSKSSIRAWTWFLFRTMRPFLRLDRKRLTLFPSLVSSLSTHAIKPTSSSCLILRKHSAIGIPRLLLSSKADRGFFIVARSILTESFSANSLDESRNCFSATLLLSASYLIKSDWMVIKIDRDIHDRPEVKSIIALTVSGTDIDVASHPLVLPYGPT